MEVLLHYFEYLPFPLLHFLVHNMLLLPISFYKRIILFETRKDTRDHQVQYSYFPKYTQLQSLEGICSIL